MRYAKLVFFLLGCLALFAAAAPAPNAAPAPYVRPDELAKTPKSHKPKKPPKPRAPNSKVSKKTKAAKKTKAPKSKGPTKSQDPGAKAPKSTKAPACNAKHDDIGCDRGTPEYLILEKAARKKGVKPAVGSTYLLIEKVSLHHKAIISTVIKTADGKLDVQNTMQQLVKSPITGKSCSIAFGAECRNAPRESYKCIGRYAKYKFVGSPTPEFADSKHFIAAGNELLQKKANYNIFTNNCQIFARKLANVAMGKGK